MAEPKSDEPIEYRNERVVIRIDQDFLGDAHPGTKYERLWDLVEKIDIGDRQYRDRS